MFLHHHAEFEEEKKYIFVREKKPYRLKLNSNCDPAT